jgi:hypothetical protein
VFGETAPTLTITRSASMHDASLVINKITAFKLGLANWG